MTTIKERLLNEDILNKETSVSLSDLVRAKKYLRSDKMTTPIISKVNFSNSSGITKASIKSAINSMIYNNTDGYKEEMPYREGSMVKNLDAIEVIDHENGIVTAVLHSDKLNHIVEIIVNDESKTMKRGFLVG